MENKLISGAFGYEMRLTSRKMYFNEIPQLRNKRIKHIDCFGYFDLPKSPNNNDLYWDKSSVFLTIKESNTSLELIQDLNVMLLNRNGEYLFINKIIDFQNSFIELKGAESITNKSFYFVFYYDEPASWSVLMQKNNRTSIKSLTLKLDSTRTYFKDNLDLKNRKIQNLYFGGTNITPFGDAAITNMNNKFITLSKNNVEFFYRVPLSVFFRGSKLYDLRLQNITFDFQQSYIETLTTTADDLKTVFFNVIIDDSK